ncbi:YggS family pyridoxal phosphate-dependent enzyme [Nocardioides daphniae]|uniref:Pyridoxal phosphate homeostasis protein n=1 Tax=Nocardioides daphniae TaxID=402297 RepID=A0A4P7UAS5_9ACTN|nr:YggS family pyridoxal phosphate-dependent enzyme [Nocardioides daphniae]QCC77026.1 YggS family pyridoxal phosphate-dependent enzyme [Nocardioides daphniae]GGD18791.1 YggS family pyridoxal phosphate enzyme [Nocardioides daphniae]
MTARVDELRAGLATVRERIARACRAVDRAPDEVSLVVVTKYFPASDVRLLAELGVTDVGENRHQEAEAKAHECADLGLRWHFIGGLQSNKAAAVGAYAHVVESVDRTKLVAPLSRGAAGRPEPVEVLLQVSLDPPGAAHRSGAPVADLAALADAVADAEHLRLAGLMAVAPLGADPDAAFARLAEVCQDVLTRHPEARVLSAGMSGDLEQAIAHGATHVRVGSAILGPRPVIL